MPRDSSGTYTLPAGNPVVAGTAIAVSWGNTTMDDIADELTDSLSRSGKGGMSVPLEFSDGSVSAPGITFGNESSSGLYRAGPNDIRFSLAGTDKVRWTASEVMEFNLSSVWTSIDDIGGTAELAPAEVTTAQTFALDDAQTFQLLTGTTNRTWTIPPNSSVDFPVGSMILVGSRDTAVLTLDPDSGVTVTTPIAQGSTTSLVVPPGGVALLLQVQDDEWMVFGDVYQA